MLRKMKIDVDDVEAETKKRYGGPTPSALASVWKVRRGGEMVVTRNLCTEEQTADNQTIKPKP